MPKLPEKSQAGSTKSDLNSSSKKISLTTFLSRLHLPVTLDVAIVRVNNFGRIWTLDFSGKLSTRLLDTDLEALAYTFLVNHSYIQGSLTLRPTSNKGIRAILSSSPRTGRKSMTASMTLYPAGWTKFCGHGEEKLALQEPPY